MTEWFLALSILFFYPLYLWGYTQGFNLGYDKGYQEGVDKTEQRYREIEVDRQEALRLRFGEVARPSTATARVSALQPTRRAGSHVHRDVEPPAYPSHRRPDQPEPSEDNNDEGEQDSNG